MSCSGQKLCYTGVRDLVPGQGLPTREQAIGLDSPGTTNPRIAAIRKLLSVPPCKGGRSAAFPHYWKARSTPQNVAWTVESCPWSTACFPSLDKPPWTGCCRTIRGTLTKTHWPSRTLLHFYRPSRNVPTVRTALGNTQPGCRV